MWRKFHLLTPVQVFIVASVSAAALALPYALSTVSADETGIFRDLLWPHQLNPVIGFGCGFIAVVPVFLGYYHLGRLGLILSTAVAVVSWYAAYFWAFFVFLPRQVFFGLFLFAAGCVLEYAFLFWSHLKAAKTTQIQEAQRALRLLPRISFSWLD